MLHINNSTKSEEGKPLLASRVIHSLPVVRSLWGFGLGVYDAAKNTSPFLREGLEIAELSATPLFEKYKSIDTYASDKVDKLGDLYDAGTKAIVPTVMSTAAFPVGYAYGLALGSMNALENTIEGTRFEGIAEKVYDIADSVIDGVLPPKEAEKRQDKSESALRNKNPVRRIGNRASLQSIRAIPSNSIRYAMGLTKKYSKAAVVKSIDYGTVFLYNRADRQYHNIERVVNLLMRLEVTRNLIAAPLPLYYELTDRYELTKNLRQGGAQFLNNALTTVLTQLDFLYSLAKNDFPHASEIIEKLSLSIYNLQSSVFKSKKRILPFEEGSSEEERLKKREKSSEERKAGWQKVTSKKKAHHSHGLPHIAAARLAPVLEVVQTVEEVVVAAIPNNPFSTLSELPEKLQSKHAHKAHEAAAKKEKPVEEEDKTAEDKEENEEATKREHEEKLKKLAQLEMQRWAAEKREHEAAKVKREQEQKAQLEKFAKEKAEKKQLKKEKKVQREIEARAHEKELIEKQAREAEQKVEEEKFEKELQHAMKHKQYLEEKEARDKELALKKKRAEVERIVNAELEKRAKEEWKASAPQRAAEAELEAKTAAADNAAAQLIAEEEKEAAEVVEEVKTVEADKVEKQLQHKEKQKKHKAAQRKAREQSKSQEAEIKEEDKEVSVIGGKKVVDEHTNWTVHTASDEKWEKVSHKHATHMSAEPILHPRPIEDATHHTPEDKLSNPFSSLEKSQQAPVKPASAVGGATF